MAGGTGLDGLARLEYRLIRAEALLSHLLPKAAEVLLAGTIGSIATFLVFYLMSVFALSSGTTTHGYSREQAAFPAAWLRHNKFWPPIGRIDNVYGDRNLFCSCVPVAV